MRLTTGWVRTRIGTPLAILGRDTSGATAVEYGVMLAFIAVAIVSAVSATGLSLSHVFAHVVSLFVGAP